MTMMLSRETIKLMMKSQKIILKEFGVRIDLDNDQAIAMFLAYATQSNSEDLKACTNKLMVELLPEQKTETEKAAEKSNTHVRYYRGQKVTQPMKKTQDVTHSNIKTKRTKQVTYR